jgi:flavodoxin
MIYQIKKESIPMKKTFLLFFILISIFSLIACGNSQTDNSRTSAENTAANPAIKENKILIVYFSHSGNTKTIANHIHEQVGGDMFEIKTVNNYPSDYDSVLEQARKEKAENYRPKLSDEIKDIKEYDIIYIGFPNWLGDMPMAVYAFLEQYDFSGKTIIPFTTHGSSGFSNNINTIKSILPDSVILEGLAVSRASIQNSKNEVNEWLKKLEMTK